MRSATARRPPSESGGDASRASGAGARMNREPMVSVVIPTYNRAAMLRDAIDSVFAQTYTDHEIVVVDDGSTDGTRAVLDRYGDSIATCHVQRVGPARARNVGMQQARGRYVAYLDSDDLYYPHKLALQVDCLERHPDTVMVYSDFSAFDDAGYWDEFHLRTYHESAYRSALTAYDTLFGERESLADNALARDAACRSNAPHWLERSEYRGLVYDAYLQNTIVFTNSMLFRRSLIPAVGLQNPYFGHFHDLEFALRICRQGKVAFIDNPTYKLRYHPGQVSSRVGPAGEENAAKLQRGLLRVARAHGLRDQAYYRAHRASVDGLVSRLLRAAAIPLIAYGGPSPHRRRYFPRRARVYLARCAQHGHPQRMLVLVSYLPSLLKRIYFKLAALSRKNAAGVSR